MKPLEERINMACYELKELAKWVNEETKKVSEQLEREKIERNLDSNRKAYSYIQKEFNKRFKLLCQKYDLPPGTELNFHR